MLGITWADVRATIPQPLQAHDSVFGDRTVTMRLWYTPAAQMPYKVELRFLVDATEIERWTHDYAHGSGIARATAAYTDVRERAVKWLTGAPMNSVRPRPIWTITVNNLPY